jgi:hypothetical protein
MKNPLTLGRYYKDIVIALRTGCRTNIQSIIKQSKFYKTMKRILGNDTFDF